jgi:hypothetical protein
VALGQSDCHLQEASNVPGMRGQVPAACLGGWGCVFSLLLLG